MGTMPVRWTLIRGVSPSLAQFEVIPNVADEIFGVGNDEHVLNIELDPQRSSSESGGDIDIKKVTVNQLSAITERHGSTPHTRIIVLADKRWKWPRRYVSRSYNVTRRGGDFRMMGNVRIENATPTPLISFAAFSLINETTRWTAIEVLADIMDALGVVQYELPIKRPEELPIQNLFIDAQGHTAVEEVLRYLPGLSLYVNYDGTVVFFDINDGSEVEIANELGPLVTQSGQIGRVQRQRIRPKRIEVLFTREIELRFDYIRPASDFSLLPSLRGDDDRRELENVMPSPDIEIEIDGTTYAAGTFITFDQAYSAWAGSESPNAPGPFDELTMRKGFVKGLAYESQLYGLDAQGEPDMVWQRRIRAALRHWRMTYRINQKWLDRIAAMRPVRVAVIDKLTGQRAPAAVFAHYLCKPTYRGIYKKLNGGSNRIESGWVVPGWSKLLSEATIAPADFKIINKEAGIIRAYPMRDPYGEADKVIWADVDDSEIPEEAPDSRRAAEIRMLWEKCEIKEEFGLAAVFSCIQGSPNTEAKFHKVIVRPHEVEGILGKTVGPSLGPVLQVRIDPSIETARFAWSDIDALAIERAFIEGNAPHNDIESLLINKEVVEDIAKAAAAAALQQFLDRVEGNITGLINGAIEIGGTVQSVTHTVAGNGAPLTSVTIPAEIQKRDMFAFLPDATRNLLLRIAQP